MKNKDIYKVLKTLKEFCKTKECCRDCELGGACSVVPSYSKDKDLKFVANTLKNFMDEKEEQDNESI